LKRANRLMLLIGVALAALSFVAVLAFGGSSNQNAKPSPNVTVVVAAADLTLGSQVTAAQLTTTTEPQAEATDSYQDPQQVVGKVVRRPVSHGAVLTTADFGTTVSVPDLVQSLGPGLRAIAVPLDSTDSVNGLIQGGDRVDVLLSMTETDGLNPIVIPNPNQSPSIDGSMPVPYTSIDDLVNNTTVKVVLQNVQVLASIPTEPVNDNNNGSSQATPAPATVVLLAVTPQQAEVVRFAQLDGNISLVLRAPADAQAPQVDTTGITLRELVDQYGVLPPAPVSPVTP
jgi:pilus assembly protein CpaB